LNSDVPPEPCRSGGDPVQAIADGIANHLVLMRQAPLSRLSLLAAEDTYPFDAIPKTVGGCWRNDAEASISIAESRKPTRDN
jgi:hypothetical protein